MALFQLPAVRYIDITNFSTASGSPTIISIGNTPKIVLYGTPGGIVYFTITDLLPNQNLTVSNTTGSDAYITTSYILGTTTPWAGNGGYIICNANNWVITTFNSNGSTANLLTW